MATEGSSSPDRMAPSRSTSSPRVLEAESIGKQGMIRSVVLSTTAVLGASMLANRYSPRYRALTLPFKVMIGSIAATGGWAVLSEKNMMRHQRAQQLEHSWIKIPEKRTVVSGWGDLLEKYRYPIIGGIWGCTMIGALAYSFSQKNLKFSQKLIHARIYAQFATILSLLMTAYLISPTDFGRQANHRKNPASTEEWVPPPSQYGYPSQYSPSVKFVVAAPAPAPVPATTTVTPAPGLSSSSNRSTSS